MFASPDFRTMRAKCIGQELSWKQPAKRCVIQIRPYQRCLLSAIMHFLMLTSLELPDIATLLSMSCLGPMSGCFS